MALDTTLYPKAYNFAIRIVKAYQYLKEDKKEFVLSKQLLRSGTSIGANIAEANGEFHSGQFQLLIFLPKCQ
jgi:four helix bundle protein